MTAWLCNGCSFRTSNVDEARGHVRGSLQHMCWSVPTGWRVYSDLDRCTRQPGEVRVDRVSAELRVPKRVLEAGKS